jgi:hypothetical protein
MGSGWLPDDGMTDYPNTRFFSGSNRKSFTTEGTEATEECGIFLCVLCGGDFRLPTELHYHA